MSLKGYRIVSIMFIILGVAMIIGAFVFFDTMPVGRKVLLVLLVGVLIAAMLYNLKVIRQKEREQEDGEDEQNL